MDWNLNNFWKTNSRTHLDFASTTPVAPEVVDVMRPYWSETWANPSAIYREGVIARRVVEDARALLARVLHIRPEEVTFVSGGTEANNLAIVGLVESLRKAGRTYESMEIISTKIEHPSIQETLAYVEERGVHVTYVPVDNEGNIDFRTLETLFRKETILLTAAYVNSEIGVAQDVKAITRAVRKWNDANNGVILTHLDASQAPLWLSCEMDRLGVDMMTLDAGKCYGPKGVGVLAHRHRVHLAPIIHGGGQESGLRSGTENTALIVGCVKSIVRAQEKYESRSLAVANLRDELFELLVKEIPGVVVNGSRVSRVANNVNISIPGLDSEYAVIWLDTRGVACSTRSACGIHGKDGSEVVREMSKDESRARSTIRFTLGEETTRKDIEKAVQILKEHVLCMQNQSV